jgi:hypothetical protein
MSDIQGKNRDAGGVGYGRPPKATRWKPGQSGNPKGRPKSLTLSEAYRKKLAEVDPEDEQGRSYAEILAEQIVSKAKTGDVAAVRELADRTEGKARQTVSLTVERRTQLEQAVEGIMRDAEAAGEPCTREEAIATLAAFTPEASDLLN